jgi:hypothetical protein
MKYVVVWPAIERSAAKVSTACRESGTICGARIFMRSRRDAPFDSGEHGPAVLHPLSGGGLEGVPSAALSPQSKKVAAEDIRYVDGVRDVCYL